MVVKYNLVSHDNAPALKDNSPHSQSVFRREMKRWQAYNALRDMAQSFAFVNPDGNDDLANQYMLAESLNFAAQVIGADSTTKVVDARTGKDVDKETLNGLEIHPAFRARKGLVQVRVNAAVVNLMAAAGLNLAEQIPVVTYRDTVIGDAATDLTVAQKVDEAIRTVSDISRSETVESDSVRVPDLTASEVWGSIVLLAGRRYVPSLTITLPGYTTPLSVKQAEEYVEKYKVQRLVGLAKFTFQDILDPEEELE